MRNETRWSLAALVTAPLVATLVLTNAGGSQATPLLVIWSLIIAVLITARLSICSGRLTAARILAVGATVGAVATLAPLVFRGPERVGLAYALVATAAMAGATAISRWARRESRNSLRVSRANPQ
jgi:hypothetical protein